MPSSIISREISKRLYITLTSLTQSAFLIFFILGGVAGLYFTRGHLENAGVGVDERVRRISEKASQKTLLLLQIFLAVSILYLLLRSGIKSPVMLPLLLMHSTLLFGYWIFRWHYSKVM